MSKKSVTTGKGDGGYTMMWANEIVSKSDDKIECLGKIDELISWIGVCREYTNKLKSFNLKLIQEKLTEINGEIIGSPKRVTDNTIVRHLEVVLNHLENQVTIPNHWFYAGKNKASSYLNYARALTRECERKLVGLMNKGEFENRNAQIYLNRLSDYFYLLSLYEDQKND